MDLQPMVSRHPFTNDSDRDRGVLAGFQVPINYTGRLAVSPSRTERDRGHFCRTNDARLAVLRSSVVDFYRQLFNIRRNRAFYHPADSSKMAKPSSRQIAKFVNFHRLRLECENRLGYVKQALIHESAASSK